MNPEMMTKSRNDFRETAFSRQKRASTHVNPHKLHGIHETFTNSIQTNLSMENGKWVQNTIPNKAAVREKT